MASGEVYTKQVTLLNYIKSHKIMEAIKQIKHNLTKLGTPYDQNKLVGIHHTLLPSKKLFLNILYHAKRCPEGLS
jgi:hypothetical protein